MPSRDKTVYAKNLEVVARPGESSDRLIKRFIKKVRNDGIMDDVYEHRFFEKPSVKRRKKKLSAKRNMKIHMGKIRSEEV